MKILYHHRIRSRDGQSVHLEELIGALRAGGHDVAVCGPKQFAHVAFGHSPKLLDHMKRLMPKVVYELLELGYNVPAYLRLRKVWRNERPDALYERYNLYLLAGLWLKMRTGVPMLLEVNSPLARERAAHAGLGLPRLARRLETWVWQHADFVLPVTQVLADEVRASGVAAKRIVVMPNAIDPLSFTQTWNTDEAKATLGLSGRIVLGFIGFMRDWHGLDLVIDWLGGPLAPRSAHLLLIGDGPALPGLKQQVARLGIEAQVTYTGLVGRDMIARMITAFDIALQPKCVEYASPLKIFEYMALGKAIVAPDQPNIREVLTHGVSALLFDPSEPKSATSAIMRLASDPPLRERLGAEARTAIATRGFTWTENARRVTALAQSAGRSARAR